MLYTGDYIMSQRINPFDKVTASTKESASYNSIDAIDKCPVCQKQMRVLQSASAGIDVFVCLEHRVVLPTQD